MISLPNSTDNETIADWVELYLIAKNRPLSKSDLIQILNEDYGVDEEDIEPKIDSVFNILDHRLLKYTPLKHYNISGNRINPLMKWNDIPELTMCLIFSLSGVEKKKGKNDGTKYFEFLSNVAIKSFFNCESIVLGFPAKTTFNTQIQNFLTLSNEKSAHALPRHTDKDKGVDIIAWKSFSDNRNNQLIILIQCGAGYHFNEKKSINKRGWNRIIDFAFDPLTGITVPHLISEQKLWEDMGDNYEIIFDRARLAKNIFKSKHIDVSLRKDIKAWCKEKLN